MEPSLIGHHLHPGDTYNIDNNIIVTAFNSTDLGVSYLLQYDNFTIMHCGDLNYWHWMDESTLYEISNAENEYKKIIKEIKKYSINVTMFPLDPSQGNMYDAGANYYIMEIKPDILIPMHFWNKTDMVFEYQKKNLDQKTKIVPLINSGDSINILFENKKIQQIEKYHLIRQISKNNTIENNIEKEIDLLSSALNEPF